MNYGLYMSSSAVLTGMHMQDVAANNLANVNTVGFKAGLASIQQRDAESIEDGLGMDMANQMLDKLGGGVLLRPSAMNTSNGSLDKTENPLDLGIQGEGFFMISGENGQPMLTRDGRFGLGTDNRLVTSTGGFDVLDVRGRPIKIDPNQPMQINERGVIRQGGDEVGQIRLMPVAEPGKLHRLGGGMFEVTAVMLENDDQASGNIEQGHVEKSNVDPIQEMLKLIKATGAVTKNANMIKYHDQTMERAVSQLGRVA